MKAIIRNCASLLTAASLVAIPLPAAAQSVDYDKNVYNLLLDCATLNTLFAQAAEKESEKDAAMNSAVGFISAAENLSGAEIKDYSAELDPRRNRLLDQLRKKDPELTRLVRTCAAIERVGRDAMAVSKSK